MKITRLKQSDCNIVYIIYAYMYYNNTKQAAISTSQSTVLVVSTSQSTVLVVSTSQSTVLVVSTSLSTCPAMYQRRHRKLYIYNDHYEHLTLLRHLKAITLHPETIITPMNNIIIYILVAAYVSIVTVVSFFIPEFIKTSVMYVVFSIVVIFFLRAILDEMSPGNTIHNLS